MPLYDQTSKSLITISCFDFHCYERKDTQTEALCRTSTHKMLGLEECEGQKLGLIFDPEMIHHFVSELSNFMAPV